MLMIVERFCRVYERKYEVMDSRDEQRLALLGGHMIYAQGLLLGLCIPLLLSLYILQ